MFEVTDNYRRKYFLEGGKNIYLKADIKDKVVVWFLRDRQMSNEWFWGDVNCVLISTDIFDMFTNDEKVTI